MNRIDLISEWININKRMNYGEEPTPCIFQITTPKFLEDERLEDDESIKVLTDIFDKYGIGWQRVDTIGGAFNLNRDWIETKDIPCYIEYCGVYPIKWDVEDVATLEKLDYDGKVIIKVLWHTEDEKFIPNH